MSVARTGLPHRDRTTSAQDGSDDRDDTAADRSRVAVVADEDDRLAARPQLPAPDHPASGGNGSGPPRDSRTRVHELSPTSAPPASACTPAMWPPRPGSVNAAPTSCCAPSAPRTSSHDPAALSRLPGRPHCRHRGYVPAGMELAGLPLPGLRPGADPGPAVQPRSGRERPGRLRRLRPARDQAAGWRGRPARHQLVRSL
jgi:hypothetical protein